MNKDLKKIVATQYAINEEFLNELSHLKTKSSFFKKSLKFYQAVKLREVSSLSDKQLNWLTEIEAILHDRVKNKVNNFELKNIAHTEEKMTEPISKKGINPEILLQEIKKGQNSWISKIIEKIRVYFN